MNELNIQAWGVINNQGADAGCHCLFQLNMRRIAGK